MKRAQSYVDYLILFTIIGTVILIVLIALGEMPSFRADTSAFTDLNQAEYPISVDFYAINCSQTTLFVKNNLPEIISLDAVAIDGIICEMDKELPYKLSANKELHMACYTKTLCQPGEQFSFPLEVGYTRLNTEESAVISDLHISGIVSE